jgi:hypothetical protein
MTSKGELMFAIDVVIALFLAVGLFGVVSTSNI